CRTDSNPRGSRPDQARSHPSKISSTSIGGMMADAMRSLFSHRDFRLLFGGQLLSTLGDRIVLIALALYVTQIGTPTDVGLVLGAATLPMIAFLLIGGVWADRLPRHRVMLASDLVRAV